MSARGAAAFRLRLREAGLGLLGSLAPADYDALVPPAWQSAKLHSAAREWIVVASGGRSLFAAFESSNPLHDVREPRDGVLDPLDRFVRARVAAACEELAAVGTEARAFHYDKSRGGAFADFVALGRACGLGAPAPAALGLAMHAEFGPWWSIRAIVGVSEPGAAGSQTKPVDLVSPCLGCAAPCVSACRGAAVLAPEAGRAVERSNGIETFDADACAATRAREPACAERCDARRACPVGAEAAYTRAAEAHHMRASLEWIVAGRGSD